MKVKYVSVVVLLTVLFYSCSIDEEEYFDYTVSISNNTSENLQIEVYDRNDSIISNYIILPMSSIPPINYSATSFSGFIFSGDSIVFKFENHKGYSCAFRQNGDEFCFNSKSPFDGSEESFTNLEGNLYEFIVDEEIRENAFELPN